VKNGKGISPDVRLIEGVPVGWKIEKDGPPPSRRSDRERRTITVDQIRDLENWLATAPFESKYKIAILRRFEDANESASNAFLKTLEEPEPDVVLLLTAPDPSQLLPTILSRVQQVPMNLLTTSQIKSALEQQWEVEPDEATLIAALAAGRMGWAVQAVKDEEMLENRKTQLETLARLPSLSTAQRFDIAQRLSTDSDKLRGILELWLLWWRLRWLGCWLAFSSTGY